MSYILGAPFFKNDSSDFSQKYRDLKIWLESPEKEEEKSSQKALCFACWKLVGYYYLKMSILILFKNSWWKM